jgi:hypothetical protein
MAYPYLGIVSDLYEFKQSTESKLDLIQDSNDVLSSEANETIIAIKPDSVNSYEIELGKMLSKQHIIVHDDGTIIADIICENSKVVIKTYTDKQVNLIGSDIKCAEILVQSQGALLIDSKISSKKVIIEAPYISIDQDITATEFLSCQSNFQSTINSEIKAANAIFKSALLIQNGKLIIDEKLAIQAVCYKQDKKSVISTDGLELFSEQAELFGELIVHGKKNKTFIISNNLFCGSKDSVCTIKVNGEHYIHLGDLKLIGDTQVSLVGSHDSTSQIIIDESLKISKESCFDIKNTKKICKTLDVEGELVVDNVLLLASDFYQLGVFDSCNATINIENNYIQLGEANSIISESKFKANNINLLCKFELDKSSIYCQRFASDATYLSISNTSIVVLDEFRVSNGISIKENCKIKTDKLYITGHCKIDDVLMHVKSLVTFNRNIGQEFSCNNLILDTAQLTLVSQDESESFLFKSVDFVFDMLIQKGISKFERSLLTSVTPRLSQRIEGRIELENSYCILDGQIYISKDGKLSLGNLSAMTTQRLWNQGKVNLVQSKIDAEELLDQGDSIHGKKSKINVRRSAVVAGKETILDDGSSFIAENLYCNNGQIKLSGKSHLTVLEKLFVHEDADLSSDESRIKSKEAIALGVIDLKASLLSVDELAIYHQFNANDNSVIIAKESVVLAQLAEAKINQSSLSSKRIDILGQVKLAKSQMQAEEKLTAWSSSEVTLSDGSRLLSKGDMDIHGKLKTEVSKDEKGNEILPRVNANGTLYLSRNASVSGDGLQVEANTIYQDAGIDVDKFLAKGINLYNSGYTRASSLILNFDNFVFNTGNITADNLIIHSNVLMSQGLMAAKKSYSSVSLVNLNFGIVSANNVTQDSLFSFNGGLVLPNIFGNFSDIFSLQNAGFFAKSFVSQFVPGLSTAINLATSLPGLCASAYSLVVDTDWANLDQLKMHEFVPIVSKIKNVLTMGYNAYNGVMPSFNGLRNINITSPFNNFSTPSWTSLGFSTASMLTGTHTDNSLFRLNTGIHAGLNTSFTSLGHFNSGVELGAFSNSATNFCMYNFGLSGGLQASYTSDYIYNAGAMRGVSRLCIDAEEVDNAPTSGVIDGNNAVINIRKFKQAGKFRVINAFLTIDELTDHLNASTSIVDSVYQGRKLDAAAELNLQNTNAQIDEVHFKYASDVRLANTQLLTKILTDDSQLKVSGQNLLSAEQYNHNGKVTLQVVPSDETKNIFAVIAKEAKLNGSSDLDNASYDIEHFKDGEDFVSGNGKYNAYQFTNSLAYATKDDLVLSSIINRNASIFAEANSIIFNGTYNHQHVLSLKSTLGDILVSGLANTEDFYADSAANFKMNGNINASHNNIINAKEGFYNLGGVLQGKLVGVTAKELKNITAGSAFATYNWELPVGAAGFILGNKIFLESTEGDIANYGGVIKASDYAQLISAKDVINMCNERKYRGAYDEMKAFEAGLISGGKGEETNGIGLYIKANNKVFVDASSFLSEGSNYIEAVNGVELKARIHTYVSRDEVKKTHGGFSKKHIVEVSTTVGASSVQSLNGRNIIHSDDTIDSVATLFSAAGGTDIFAKNTVRLFSLKTQTQSIKSQSRWFGLTHDKIKQMDQQAIPSLFADNGCTAIRSANGDVNAIGAYFIGCGDLEIEAANKIMLGRDILNHSRTRDTMSLSLSAFGMSAWNAYNSGQGAWGALAATDPTLGKLFSVFNSGNTAEYLTNTANLGISAFNAASSLFGGYGAGNLLGAIESRYGLGGENGLNPTINASLTHTRNNEKFQTLGQGGIERRDVKLKAGQGVELQNGVQVNGRNVEIDAPKITAQAAALTSATTKESESVSVGVTAAGTPVDVAGSYSKQTAKATHHVNAGINASENLHMHNGDGAIDVRFLGAKATANTADLDIGTFVNTDQQDTVKTKATSVSAGSSGAVGGYYAQGEETRVAQPGGFHVAQGLNTDGHTAYIREAVMTGGAITTDGVNNIEIDKLKATSLKDKSSHTGVGVNLNVVSAAKMIDSGANTGGAAAAASTIDVATLRVDRVDFQAVRRPVIFGAAGNAAIIHEQTGEVVTTSANGVDVKRKRELHLTADIPVTNLETISRGCDKISQGVEKLADDISDLLGLSPEPLPIPIDVIDPIDAVDPDLITKGNTKKTNKKDDIKSSKDKKIAEIKKKSAIKVLQKVKENNLPKPNSKEEHKVLSVILILMKELNKAAFDKVLKEAAGASKKVKSYLKAKAEVISSIYSLIQKHIDEPSKPLSEKIKSVGTDILVQMGFDKLLSLTKSGTIIGKAITAVEIVDTLLYDESYVEQQKKRAELSADEFGKLHKDIVNGDKTLTWDTVREYAHLVIEAERANNDYANALVAEGVHKVVKALP